MVAPLAGAWIETGATSFIPVHGSEVAPLAGAWIETASVFAAFAALTVAHLAGAWIETATS